MLEITTKRCHTVAVTKKTTTNFPRPGAERVDDDIEPDEIFAGQLEQVFDDRLRFGICDLVVPAHEARHVIPARNRLVHEELSLFACRTYDGYLFHDTKSPENLL